LSDPPRIGQSDGRSLTVPEARSLLDAARDDRLEALYAITLTFGEGAKRLDSPGRTSIPTPALFTCDANCDGNGSQPRNSDHPRSELTLCFAT
jgi:hypothetical protein